MTFKYKSENIHKTEAQQGVTHYHAQLRLPDKGQAIKGLVVCNVVCLGSMKGMGLKTFAWYLVPGPLLWSG